MIQQGSKVHNHGLKYSETDNQEEVQTKEQKGIHYSRRKKQEWKIPNLRNLFASNIVVW